MRLHRQNAQHLYNLNFHGLGESKRQLSPGEEDYWVNSQLFGAILDSINGRDDIQITFDDANESDYTLALPLLRERRMSARFFIVAQRINQTNFLSSRQIQTLCTEGMVIGNHGMRHRRWIELTKTELHEELVEAKDIIEQIIGGPVLEAACPFGDYNRRVLRMLHNSGYRKAYTSDGGIAFADSWIQPRISVLRSYDLTHVLRLCATAASSDSGFIRNFKFFLKRWR
jgi:peptidoglycan/xylan/chitin deacetylase (PgdA/CDA1 family)